MPGGPVEITGVSCGTVHGGSSTSTHYLTISWTTVENFPDQTSRYVVSVLPLEGGDETTSSETNKQRM